MGIQCRDSTAYFNAVIPRLLLMFALASRRDPTVRNQTVTRQPCSLTGRHKAPTGAPASTNVRVGGGNLLRVFGHVPIDAIAPMHIREYLDIRGQVAKVRANREKALFSHVFNKAREWGYTAAQNPCQGVRSFKESGRSRYVTDDEFAKVRQHAHPTLVDAMDLALLTGQRPADVLKLKSADVRDGALSSPESPSVHAKRSAPT